jgi:hypothetical protein
MNSDQAVAMDMPPCDVLAAAMAEMRDLLQIAANRDQHERWEQEFVQLP